MKNQLVLLAITLFFSSKYESVAQDSSSDKVLGEVEKITSTIVDVSSKLWDLSETSSEEVQSSKLMKDNLTQNGFEVTVDKLSGVPTSFVAEYGSGKPILGIMLEYDALPGLGNAAVPKKQAREDGVTSGHGCGHNLLGAGALGAALALKELVEESKIAGTIRVFGAASEETEGAKVYMARDGLFNDVDAMLHWHPGNATGAFNVRTSAQQQIYVEFQGTTTHAGNTPWQGRSALDALELYLHGVNNMREHVKPTARIHYIIREGGKAMNIVPDRASLQLTIRDATRGDVENNVQWLEQMATGAALMTQTTTLFVPYYGMYDLLPNAPLAQRMQEHLEKLGPLPFTQDEQTFAKNLQAEVKIEATGLIDAVLPLPNEPTTGGSTDVGDASWITPTMGVVVATIPQSIGLHTWMATACHGTGIGHKGAVHAAKALTLLGWDILTDESLRTEMRKDFEKRTEGFVYKSPIPDIIKEPISLPEAMRSFGSVIEVREALLNQQHDHGHAHGGSFE